MKRPAVPAFESRMSKAQSILGWCYLPMHIVVIPLLSGLLAYFSPEPVDETAVNVAYYTIGLVFTLFVMGSWLRRDFDTLLDNWSRCLLCMLFAYAVYWALSFVTAALLLWSEGEVVNPNNEAVMEMSGGGYGPLRGLAIFIAPLVEETLFRGVVFGSLRRRGWRIPAYVVSIAAFSIYHIWQYVLLYADASLFIYALQYIPVSAALAWVYDRSGTIWSSIFFHMLINLIAFQVLTLL